MISPVSFGSTYNVFVTKSDINRNIYSHPKIAEYCRDNDIKYDFSLETEEKPMPEAPDIYKTVPKFDESINEFIFCKYTLVAPDSKDNDIETICSNLGIKYKKHNTEELANIDNVKSRIVLSDSGFSEKYLVNIDVDRLEDVIKYQSDNNFFLCEESYNKFYKQDVQFMIKSGENIPAPSLYIEEIKPGSLDKIPDLGYIPGNSFSFKFNQETRNADHCLYHALKEMGMKTIPVCVDSNTYTIGNILGLFVE